VSAGAPPPACLHRGGGAHGMERIRSRRRRQ